MILSASRRTDIPAFYSAWLLNRLRQGFVCVRNPMNPAQVSRIALSPETVDCIVFWTKDPAPMLDKLGEIRSMGYEFYFQFTLTPYGREIERHLPEKRVLAETFRRLSRAVGRERVVWRYDPVLLTGDWTPDRHFEAFGALCRELEGCAEECVFSFVDRYAKIARRTAGLVRDIAPGEMERTAAGFAETARRHGLKLSACAETAAFSRSGTGRALHRPGPDRAADRLRDPGRKGPQPAPGVRLHRERGHRRLRHMPAWLPVLLRLGRGRDRAPRLRRARPALPAADRSAAGVGPRDRTEGRLAEDPRESCSPMISTSSRLSRTDAPPRP